MNIHLDKIGGTEHSMWDIADAMSLRGHNVSIIYHQKTAYSSENKEVRIYRIPVLKTQILPNLLQLFRMFLLIKRVKPDIVVLQNVYNIWAIMLLSRIVPTVRFVRSHEIYCVNRHKYIGQSYDTCIFPQSKICMQNCSNDLCFPLRLFRYYYRRFALSVNKQLRFTFVASNYMKNNLTINGFDEKKISIIPPFVDMFQYKKNIKNEPIVLFVGRIERDKGSEVLPQIVASIPSHCRMVIVGEGDKKSSLVKSIRELGISNRVDFFDWLTREELAKKYLSARVVVLPSLWEEPFGRVGIEAMAAGKPVVAFNCGGVSDWLENNINGFLVPKGDIGNLLGKINLLLDDTELSLRMGSSGVDKVKTLFGRNFVIENFENCLNDILYN